MQKIPLQFPSHQSCAATYLAGAVVRQARSILALAVVALMLFSTLPNPVNAGAVDLDPAYGTAGGWAATAGYSLNQPVLLTSNGKLNSSNPAGQPVPLSQATAPDEASQARVSEIYGKLPLSFEVNRGQTGAQVKFLSRGSGYNLFLTSTEAVLALSKPGARTTTKESPASLRVAGSRRAKQPLDVLRMKLVNANPQPHVAGYAELPGKSNYFTGNDPQKWRTSISNYAKIKYHEVYPGVDMVYYGNQGQLEYDFVVAPAADPGAIKLSFKGAQRMRIDGGGDLVLRLANGEVRQHKPVVFQEAGGVRTEIAGRYVITGKHQVGFEVAGYDASKPLVIDPVLTYSTYLGGSGGEDGRDIAVDGAGNAYVTGLTRSINFPTTPGAFQPAWGGDDDAFVTKLNASGSALIYSTYLGGSNADEGFGITVDNAGDAFITGITESLNFPVTPGAFQPANRGSRDAFVTKLNPTGTTLVYSTYLGGTVRDDGQHIVVDGAGNAYVAGFTGSLNFPVTPGAFQPANGGGRDAFVAKLNSAGSALVYATYLGGVFTEESHGIAIDNGGDAYVTGLTNSFNFPTTPGAFQTAYGGSDDAFVTKLNSTGSALVYSTYLGGSFDESGLGIVLDGAGNAYTTGRTDSLNFPVTPGAYQPANAGSADAFVTTLSSTGSALVYSTYLGGSSFDAGADIGLDNTGSAHVTGVTGSLNFPATPDAFQPANAGLQDAFVTKLNSTGSTLHYSTYLGGTAIDQGRGIVVDTVNNAYVTGYTFSPDFPVTPGAFQPANGGFVDAFVVKIASTPPDADNDGVADAVDNCPDDANPDQADADGDEIGDVCDPDDDNDGVNDTNDNCPVVSNPDQTNTDGDGDGNACDVDDDNDGVADTADNCPLIANPDQADDDNDGAGDACDPDTTPPTISCPANLTVEQDSVAGATVTFNVTATDSRDPNPSIVCAPASGSTFPLGTTTVTCTATDVSSNSSSCSFTVTVVPPTNTLDEKVNGGGSILLTGGTATFGVRAVLSTTGEARGNLTYQDHTTGRTVKSTVITAVVGTATQARIFGRATIDGTGSFDFMVEVIDNGEPGSADVFRIQLSNGYMAGGTLNGGNIQVRQ
jgi:hypothetical protein